MSLLEPNEPAITRDDCVEELVETLADVTSLWFRAHSHHWNVKGPAFGAYHELFGQIYSDVFDSIDPWAEQLLKLGFDAPASLGEIVDRSSLITPVVATDDPVALAADLFELNSMVIVGIEETFDAANAIDEQGLANFAAERLDAHKKWAWQLSRSISSPSETPVSAPQSPVESVEGETPERSMEVFARRAVVEGRERLVVDLSNIEIRSAGEEGGPAAGYYNLRGHAAIFNHDSHDLGGFIERLEPGAFAGALKDSRVHLLFNHDSNYPLASTDSGTLELREDEFGLQVWAKIPEELSYARDLKILMQSGIARDMSFAFTLPEDGSGETWTRSDDGTNLRTISRIEALYDVSAVVRGAYGAPSYDMRNVLGAAVEAGRLPVEGTEPVAQDVSVDVTPVAEPETDGMGVERSQQTDVLREKRQRKLKLARKRTR
ncbi:MAG: HK97 family phage prohead protease [Actinomycetes bacterium]